MLEESRLARAAVAFVSACGLGGEERQNLPVLYSQIVRGISVER
jgi:hypothetical protein